MFKTPLLKVETEADAGKLAGRSSEWGLHLDIKNLRERIETKHQQLFQEVGSASKSKSQRSAQIRTFYT